MNRPLGSTFFERPAEVVAPDLLGRYLLMKDEDGERSLRIVETEAYLGSIDRASHAWNGRRTRRTQTLYLPPGHLYVYLIYGLHHCLNFVTGGEPGSAVLVRAGEAIDGVDLMTRNRNLNRKLRPRDLAGGPGKLSQALGIDRQLDASPLGDQGLTLTEGDPLGSREVCVGPRVGIDYAKEAIGWPLRFAIQGNSEVSRPRILPPLRTPEARP